MGDKYIIELEEKPFHDDNGDFLYRVKGFNSLVFDMTGINKLISYTEPDLEQVRKEAYEAGAKSSAVVIADDKAHEAYQHGLNDAWDAARTLWDTPNRKEIFGHTTFNTVLTTLTAQETIEKIRQYEQRQEEIKVGDEVVSEDDIKAVVIDMDDYLLHVLDENGVVQGWPREDVAKTERHFPEIAAVLEKMKGGK